jgi:Skp family chaperone for outer membrane proteins
MRTNWICSFFLSLFFAVTASGQVSLKKKAVVYVGSAANTSAPATVLESKIRAATVEWKKMKAEGIDTNSARGKQLITKMNQRIRKAVKAIADSEGRDMVTRKRDLKDDRGRSVVDLTGLVIAELER